MAYETLKRFTCDKCKAVTETVNTDPRPDKWTEVFDGSSWWQLCGVCSGKLRAFMKPLK